MPFRYTLHTVRTGLKSVALHKLRSSLTVLGIVLGVASVIVMLAVGEAARFEAIRQIQELGATNIIVRTVKPTEDTKEDEADFLLTYGLTDEDLQRIRMTIPSVVAASPIREFRKELRNLDHKLEGRVVGVTPNYLELNSLQMSRGRFISQLDNDRFVNVAVLAAETAEELFPFDDPIGKSVRIGTGHYYRVVGVTGRRTPSAGIGGSFAAQDYNRDIYIPFQTDKVRFGEILTYERAGTWNREKLEISQITVAIDDMKNVRRSAEIIEGLIDQFHDQKDTVVIVPLDLLERVEQTQKTFTILLGSIASISLLVGGIGIMNIMLATVTERTREIGIRRALGAKRRDINRQFLVECVVLSGGGGLLGIGMGIGASGFVTDFFGMPTIIPLWSPTLAFGISVLVGLIFGTYPARRAAQMDPIEALRHE